MNHKPPPNPPCHDAIVAFAEMKLDRWHGLPACTHDDLAVALGPGGPEWDGGFGRIHIYPGRAATPTIAILGEDGRFIAAWTERPTATQSWFLEQQKVTMQKPLHDQLEAWYASDAGKTTVAEIAALLSR